MAAQPETNTRCQSYNVSLVGDRRHIFDVEPVDVFQQQTEQRQVKRSQASLLTLKNIQNTRFIFNIFKAVFSAQVLVILYGAHSPWRSNDRQRRVWSSGSSAPVQRSDGCLWTPAQLRPPPLATAPPGSDSYRNHQLKSSPAEDLTETQREGCEFRTENTKHHSWTIGMETTGFITIETGIISE